MGLIPDLPLARFTVDRASQLRSDSDWLVNLWQSESTRALYISQGRVPVTEELSLVLVQTHELTSPAEETVLLLGTDTNHAYLAVAIAEPTAIAPLWVSLRDVGAQLSPRDVGLAITATALATWHETHQYCVRCGIKTALSDAGWSRSCPNSCVTHFPRTEPAIIVSIEDKQERILLGRRTNWPETWFSTLAGFVEAGESCEAAVIREVREESGVEVDVKSLQYLGSQPWPFPASLMLGYRVLATTDELKPDGDEIAELRWFTRTELRELCEVGALKLPNPAAISWHLIEHWFGQPLAKEWTRG
ncbi:MAG: NAD(+) diphosphatase [Actinobacteria bacterium]|nr:NAD(+) diphosphatase [Actinomycetota bacterium]NBY15258.1 NAD(+) diphosphatase [Actinomycetota bacterium]